MTVKPVIAIIGGGYSGTFTLVQLIKQATFPVDIFLVNKKHPLVKGIAYGTSDKNHLLNVAAGKMSPFPDDPDHFVRWIRSQKSQKNYVDDDLPLAYLPRAIYGDYLKTVFDETI